MLPVSPTAKEKNSVNIGKNLVSFPADSVIQGESPSNQHDVPAPLPLDPVGDLVAQMECHLALDPELPICGIHCKHVLDGQEETHFRLCMRQGKMDEAEDELTTCVRYRRQVGVYLLMLSSTDIDVVALAFTGIRQFAFLKRPFGYLSLAFRFQQNGK